MQNNPDLQTMWDQFQTLILFLERPVVQGQIGSLVAIMVVAWFLSEGLWYIGRRHFFIWVNNHLREKARQYGQKLSFLIEYLAFPLLSLLLLQLTIDLFENQKALAALISNVLSFFWAFLIYRLVLALLYFFIGKQEVQPYHHRLLRPLFWLIAMMVGLNILIDLGTLARIELFTLFNDPTTIADLFGVGLSLYLLSTLAWAAQDLLHKFIKPRTSIEPGAISAALTLGRYSLIAIGILIILSGLGFDATSLAVIGGGLSIGIGFGLQTIVSNFISGIVLLFEQSLRPGDIIEVEGVLGRVDKLSVRATTVRTFDDVEMIIPNETLFTSTVTTHTQSSRVTRIFMIVGVSYDSDPKEVMEVLLEAAHSHGLVLDNPEPAAFFEDYGPSSLDFHLAIWLEDPTYRKRVSSDLRLMIWKEFERRGIEIPFPQRDLHIRSGAPWLETEKPPDIQ